MILAQTLEQSIITSGAMESLLSSNQKKKKNFTMLSSHSCHKALEPIGKMLRDKNSSIRLSISVAMATADPQSCYDAHCLFERIAELKKKMKKLEGSNFLIE